MQSTIFALAVASMASGVYAVTGTEMPSAAPTLNAQTVQGCFKSAGDLEYNSTQTFNSIGKCAKEICLAGGFTVAASTKGSDCYCGNSYPAASDMVADKYCNAGCTGYGPQACGGDKYWTVYNTGLEIYDIPVADSSSSSSSSAGSSSSPATKTSTSTSAKTTAPATGATTANPRTSTTVTTDAGGQTIFITTTPTETTEAKSGGSSSGKTAGIAAGTVVGVVVVAGIVGGVLLYMRRRRNREIEEEHRRNAAVNAFFNGKPPSSSGGYSAADSRLDPVMAQRRLSDGSIADNQGLLQEDPQGYQRITKPFYHDARSVCDLLLQSIGLWRFGFF